MGLSGAPSIAQSSSYDSDDDFDCSSKKAVAFQCGPAAICCMLMVFPMTAFACTKTTCTELPYVISGVVSGVALTILFGSGAYCAYKICSNLREYTQL